jgi:VWFA-related protein
MLGRLWVIWPVAVALCAQTASSPEQAAGGVRQGSQIQVQVNEVIVPVTVTDDKGRFVSNLEQKDFKIFDQNIEQTIQYFNAERNQPVVIGFLIEQSNAQRLHWKTFQKAAEELVLALMPEDPKFSGYLISYSNEPELQVNTTHDPSEFLDKIRKMKPGGGSALFDAIYMACTNRELVEGEPIEPRRVIVIIGDGHDNASKKTLAEVIELAQRNLVTVHAVSTVAFDFHGAEESNLLKLAKDTGGRVEYPLNDLYKDISGYLSKPSDAGNYAITVGTGGYSAQIAQGIFGAIAGVQGEITTQYILRYTPTVTDDPRIFRSIRVQVNLPNVVIRHRTGYYPYAP